MAMSIASPPPNICAAAPYPARATSRAIPAARSTGFVSSRLRSVIAKAQDSARNNGVPIFEEARTSNSVEEGYIGLFVRMLGLDKPIEEREEGVNALWRHSEGGKENVDEIVQFPRCLNLVVSLIPCERPDASEAACGLLRQVAAIDAHRSLVADAGAIEEITGLLTRKAAPFEVREQALYVLWNLSAEEKLRAKIASVELLPVLIAMLESEEQTEQTAAAGILSNLALSEHLHFLLLEADVVPKLAKLLKEDLQKVSKLARQEARSGLLELSRTEEAKMVVIEEGLMFVPVVGADAYKSLKLHLEAPAQVPETVKLEHPLGSRESDFGAGDVLLGLNVGDREQDVDEATQLAMEGRVKLRFLSRVGLLGKESGSTKAKHEEMKQTIMPWWDAIPRLVLILGLENVAYAKRAAESVAEVAINEECRQALAKAGAIPHLVYMLGSGDESATEVAALAIEKLSISHKVRGAINSFAAIEALVAVLNAEDVPDSLQDKVLGALVRLSQTQEEVKAMVQSGFLGGIMDLVNSEETTYEAKVEAENVMREISSLKTDPRDKIARAGGISALIKCLCVASMSCKEKAAAVLENIATKEVHAISIVQAGVHAGLSSMLEARPVDEDAKEESMNLWLVVCAASRLLSRLLSFEAARKLVDCPAYVRLLSTVLKEKSTPLFVKDWVSFCLLKLAQYADPVDVPVDLEVKVHDTIPRLLEEMKLVDSSSRVRDAAILELRDLISSGVPDYVAAIAKTPGGIFAVVESLTTTSPAARAAALSILHSLATNDENHPAIVAAGAVPLLERIVRGEVGEWKQALDLLRLLPV